MIIITYLQNPEASFTSHCGVYSQKSTGAIVYSFVPKTQSRWNPLTHWVVNVRRKEMTNKFIEK